MNGKKFLSILTIIAVVLTTVIPVLGESGDGTGGTEWPANINISESSLEATSYKLGDVKEFEIGYYPANSSGAVIEAVRHIEITGGAEVTDFAFSEDRTTWKPISEFEGNIKITTTTVHKVRAAFPKEGKYTIRFWMTNSDGEFIIESKKEIYVSDGENDGDAGYICVVPSAPTDLAETTKYVFLWNYNSNKTVKYNFYIDDEKINDEEISLNQYDASGCDKFTPGVHTISVTCVLVKNNVVMHKVESAPVTIEYTVEGQSTETESGTTAVAPTETESDTTVVAPTETESNTTVVTPTETESGTTVVTPTETESNTTVVAPTETESNTTVVVPTETEIKTTAVPTTTTAKPSATKPTTKSSLTKGKLYKVSKKASAKKVKVTFKRIKKATSYEVQICSNKKFKKKNTVKKIVKTNKCTFRKLKPNKIYYVRVRAVRVVKGKTIRGKWSNKQRIKLKK